MWQIQRNMPYRVRYEDVPDDLWSYFESNNTIEVSRTEIIQWSPNKKDLESQLKGKQFDL